MVIVELSPPVQRGSEMYPVIHYDSNGQQVLVVYGDNGPGNSQPG